MTALDELERLVPPPAKPTAATGDWEAVERELGRKLPLDWKALVERYGYGNFGELLVAFSPFFAPCTMMAQARGMLDADRELQQAVPEAVPFALYPEKDGALPWAQSENGHGVYWITWSDDPGEWPVAVFHPRGGKLELYEGGAAAFLHGWLSGALTVPGFPSRSERPRPTFDRWIERAHEAIQLEATGGPPDGHEGTAYDWRLRALLAALGEVERRGEYGDEEGEKRQVHFVTEGGDCRFTYDTVYGHNVRIAAPPDQIAAVRAAILGALPAMGCAKK